MILSDVRMSGLDGVGLLKLLRERHSDADVILMTAFDDMSTVVSAMREGAAEFLVKPLDLHDLRRVIERVFDDRRARTRAGKRDDSSAPDPNKLSGDVLFGRDPRMLAVYKLIGQAAVSRATALIRGETVIHHVRNPSVIIGVAVSPDGTQLAVNLRGKEYGTGVLNLIPATGGTPKEIYRFSPSESPNMNAVAWTPSGQQILFGVMQTSDDEGDTDVRALPVSGGVPHSIGIPLARISALEVSPDGQRIAYGINDFSAELWTMEAPKFEPARKAAGTTR